MSVSVLYTPLVIWLLATADGRWLDTLSEEEEFHATCVALDRGYVRYDDDDITMIMMPKGIRSARRLNGFVTDKERAVWLGLEGEGA